MVANFTYLLIYIYIYIYISHPQTDCFVLSELFSVANTQDASEPGSKPVQLYARLWFRPLFFNTLSAKRVLNSFEELRITLAAAGNSFVRELNPHGGVYIVIHRQTVSFYQNSSVWLDTQDARSRDQNPSNFTLDFLSIFTYTFSFMVRCCAKWNSLSLNGRPA